MKAFSKHNLINQELHFLHEKPTGIMNKIMYKMYRSARLKYTISIPATIFLRGEIFCDDIRELSGVNFNHDHLLSLLYKDFLSYVRRTNDLYLVYNQLKVRSPKEAEVTSTTELVYIKSKKAKTYSFDCYLERKDALRGEIILADLDEIYPDHDLQLEDILITIYCDFIAEFKKGNTKEAMERIINHFET